MDRVRGVSVGQRGIAFVGADGQIAARMPAELFGGEGIVSEVEVLRGDLGQVLYEATVPATEYLFDDTARRLDQDDEGVTVTFEKARPRRFGLVIGADGLNSAVRGLAFGPQAQYVRPLGCYTAWFTAPAEFDPGGWFLMHNVPGGLVASIRPGRVPGEIKAGLSFRSAPIDYDPRDTASQMDILASRFSGAGWEVPRLLKAMRTAPDFFFNPIAQVRLDRWSSRRAALVGDAGYCPTPLTGLGTSLALVGAYVLAGELAAADGDHHVAFARYEQITRPYVTRGPAVAPGRNQGLRAGQRDRHRPADRIDALDEPLANTEPAGQAVRQSRRHRAPRLHPGPDGRSVTTFTHIKDNLYSKRHWRTQRGESQILSVTRAGQGLWIAAGAYRA